MKYILLFILIPKVTMAALSECGEYEARAIVRTKKVGYEIVINEKTMSELNVSMPIEEQLKLAPYVDRPITATLLLNEKFDGSKGRAEKILSIDERIPDPLRPGDTGLKLIKKTACKKS